LELNSIKWKLPRVVSFFLSILLFLSSCNDLPTDIGSNLMNDSVAVFSITNVDTTILYNTTIPEFKDIGFNTTYNFCGKANDIEALTLVRFGNLPDTLDYLTADDIVSAQLFLYPNRYAFGDTNNAVYSFSVKKVENYWSDSANWDSVHTAGFMGKTLGTHSGAIKLQDTMERVAIDLDKSFIPEWFQLRTDTSVAAPVINWGIALVPDNSSNVVYTYGGEGISTATDNIAPVMKVLYHNKESELDSIYLYTGINATFFKAPEIPKDEILFQGGMNIKTNLYFDLSMIPQNSAIASMVLEFTLDKTKSFFGNLGTIEYFQLSYMIDSVTASDQYYYYVDKQDSNKVLFRCNSVTSAAELWNRDTGKGILQLSSADFEHSYGRLDRYVFYGINDPDPSKRPKVRVIYTKQTKIKN